jgi:integrase
MKNMAKSWIYDELGSLEFCQPGDSQEVRAAKVNTKRLNAWMDKMASSPARVPDRGQHPCTNVTDTELLEQIRTIQATDSFSEGHIKMWARLQSKGLRVSSGRVCRVMRENGLLYETREREMAHKLQRKGFATHAIAVRLGRHPKTIRNYLRQPPPPPMTKVALHNDDPPRPQLRRIPEGEEPEETRRKREVSAMKHRALLIAAFNAAWREEKIPSADEWLRMKTFQRVFKARVRYLDEEECERLVAAAEPGFKEFLQGGIFTGARPSELRRLLVEDFEPDVPPYGAVYVHSRKTARKTGVHGRHVRLSRQGARFFRNHTAGRPKNAPMFTNRDGTPLKGNAPKPMLRTCKKAGIDPPATLGVLRHTYASLLVSAGVPLKMVADSLGHVSIRMVERHYGHLVRGAHERMIRKHSPRFRFDIAAE